MFVFTGTFLMWITLYDMQTAGFVIQRHSELEDQEEKMLSMSCKGIKVEPVLQDITGEELNQRVE